MGPTTHQGAPGASGAPWCLVGPTGSPKCFLGSQVVFWSKKISKKFLFVWTPFDRDILRSKKKQKTATGTGHYVNRLVPKNDIKLL